MYSGGHANDRPMGLSVLNHTCTSSVVSQRLYRVRGTRTVSCPLRIPIAPRLDQAGALSHRILPVQVGTLSGGLAWCALELGWFQKRDNSLGLREGLLVGRRRRRRVLWRVRVLFVHQTLFAFSTWFFETMSLLPLDSRVSAVQSINVYLITPFKVGNFFQLQFRRQRLGLSFVVNMRFQSICATRSFHSDPINFGRGQGHIVRTDDRRSCRAIVNSNSDRATAGVDGFAASRSTRD